MLYHGRLNNRPHADAIVMQPRRRRHAGDECLDRADIKRERRCDAGLETCAIWIVEHSETFKATALPTRVFRPPSPRPLRTPPVSELSVPDHLTYLKQGFTENYIRCKL